MKRVFALGAALVTAIGCGEGAGFSPGDPAATQSGDLSLSRHKRPGTGGTPQTPECRAATECAVPQICKQCPDGTSTCATAACVNGACETSFPPCPTGAGGAGGASGAMCKTDADCPQLGIACRICPDGSSACPSDHCVNGSCVASIPSCPVGSGGCTGSGGSSGVECHSAGDCAAPQVCKQCPDGKASCATADCINGKCTTSFPPCGGGTGGTTGTGGTGTGGTAGGLHWFSTCGDPICRVPPTNDPSAVPPCDPAKGQKAGAECTTPNAECDPGSGCGRKLLCSPSDPTHGGVCPI